MVNVGSVSLGQQMGEGIEYGWGKKGNILWMLRSLLIVDEDLLSLLGLGSYYCHRD